MNNKIIKKVAIIATVVVTLCALLGVATVSIFVNSKQFVALDFGKLNNVKNSITLLDVYGNKIEEPLYVDKYKQTAIGEINQYTIDAFVSVEDKRFYKHSGIDIRRIFGAFINNIRAGTLQEGASTITQQLIKNTHLDNKKTIRRKLNEIVLAKQLEQRFSKDEILQTYLNTVYFGKNAYGIETASNIYFNKSASELTLGESAVLAGILKAPNNYNPSANLEKCVSRRNVVLKTMLDNGYIDKSEYENAKNEDILVIKNQNFGIETGYSYQVLQEICNILDMSVLQAVNSNLVVYTYYDPICQQSLEYSLKNNTTNSYCATICDNDSCGVVAFCTKGRNAMEKRQAGSVIKPLAVYGPALEEEKITLSSPVLDEKTSFGGYSPKNFNDEYCGWTTVKNSIAKSLNVPAVKVANSVGVDVSAKYLQKLGVKDIDDEQNLSLALGNINGGIDAFELTNAYLTLANGGKYQNLAFISRIDNQFGTIYQRKEMQKQVFTEETAFLMTDALQEVGKSGTAKALKDCSFDIAVKTGTVGDKNGNTDAVICGYTTEQTYCIWLTNTKKCNFTGGGEPAKVLKGYLDIKYGDNTPNNFEIPKGIVRIALDKKQLEENQMEYAANCQEKQSNKEYFYYKNGTEPANKVKDEQKIDFCATISDGYVKIMLDNVDKDLKYQLVKTSDAKESIWLSSTNYIDRNVVAGKSYNYLINAYFGDTLVATSNTILITVPADTNQHDTEKNKDDFDLWESLKNLLYFGNN